MYRGGYDMANKTALTQQPQTANWENHHAESSTRKPGEYFESKEEIQRKWENPERTPKQEKTRQYNLKHSATDEAREAARLRTQRSRAKKREGETQTLGVMTTPATPSNEASKAIDDIPVQTRIQRKEEQVLAEREAAHRLRTRQQQRSRSMGHRGGAARATARNLRK
ncbi:unnamed protein product [Fusarium graminearum]|nr:unnamed protein product [Fusarium graminearum]